MKKDFDASKPLQEPLHEHKPREVTFNRCYRLFMYITILMVEGITNISAGLLSSASKNIKEQLNINDKTFGLFGTSNALGRIIGSSVFVLLNQKVSRKWLMISIIGLKTIFLLGFKLTNKGYILIVLRGLTGACHMPPNIYIHVWINQFGFNGQKNTQMGLIQVIQPAGKCFGYLLHILVGADKWQNAFLIQSCMLAVCVIIYIISPADYFSRTLYVKKNLEEISRDSKTKNSIFEEKELIVHSNDKEDNTSPIGDIILLAKNTVFAFGIFSRCIIFGLNTVLHFWIADFMRNNLHFNDNRLIFITYTLICVLAPLLGVIVNAILKPCIGGYDSRKASWPAVVFQTLAALSGVGIALSWNMISFVTATVSYFLFNCCVLPIIQGILISSVEERLGATGFSYANMFTQIFIAGPTPILYGAINDYYKKHDPTKTWVAMLCLMSIGIVAIPLLIFMAIARNKKFDEIENQKKAGKEGIELENKIKVNPHKKVLLSKKVVLN